MKLIRNARTALRNPDYLPQYVRYEWQRLAVGGATIRMPWGDDIGGFVNFSEYRSTPHCLDSGEITAMARIAQRLQADRTFDSDAYVLDVGANLGVVALYLSNLFPKNKVVCFEPAPTTFASLSGNIARNHRSQIVCEQLAVKDKSGEVEFEASVSRANAHIANRGVGTIKVRSVSLDAYCDAKGIQHIALLKIDTEGYEHAVIAGAQRLLDKGRVDVVYYEFCPTLESKTGVQTGTAVKQLDELGYKSFAISSSGDLIPFMIEDDSDSMPALCNLIALRGEILQKVKF